MAYRKILVPYDGSSHAREALNEAFQIVDGRDDAQVVILNVITTSDVAPTYGGDSTFWSSADLMDYETYNTYMDKAIEGAKEALQKDVAAELERLGGRGSVDVTSCSSTARGIADYAKEHNCDLIIMGRRGLGLLRSMLGSVSYGVLSAAEVPVLTVK